MCISPLKGREHHIALGIRLPISCQTRSCVLAIRAESSEGLYEVSNLFYHNEGLRFPSPPSPPIGVLSSIRLFVTFSRRHCHLPLTVSSLNAWRQPVEESRCGREANPLNLLLRSHLLINLTDFNLLVPQTMDL